MPMTGSVFTQIDHETQIYIKFHCQSIRSAFSSTITITITITCDIDRALTNQGMAAMHYGTALSQVVAIHWIIISHLALCATITFLWMVDVLITKTREYS